MFCWRVAHFFCWYIGTLFCIKRYKQEHVDMLLSYLTGVFINNSRSRKDIFLCESDTCHNNRNSVRIYKTLNFKKFLLIQGVPISLFTHKRIKTVLKRDHGIINLTVRKYLKWKCLSEPKPPLNTSIQYSHILLLTKKKFQRSIDTH